MRSISPAIPHYGKLSIAQLMLITAGCGFALWVLQPLMPRNNALATAIGLCFVPLYGTAIAAIIFAEWNIRFYDRAIAGEPGHYLLLFTGASFTGVGLFGRMMIWLRVEDPGTPPSRMTVLAASSGIVLAVLAGLIAGLVLVAAVMEVQEPKRWKVTLRLLALGMAIPVVGCGCIAPLGLFGVLYSVIQDLRTRKFRDFWHWAGIVAFLGAIAHPVILPLFAQFSPY